MRLGCVSTRRGLDTDKERDGKTKTNLLTVVELTVNLTLSFLSSGAPLAVSGKEESEIHHTVAELMILANSAVAKKIREAFPSAALLRVHAPPDPSRLTAFEGVAVKVGVQSAAPGGEVKRSTKGKEGVFCAAKTNNCVIFPVRTLYTIFFLNKGAELNYT